MEKIVFLKILQEEVFNECSDLINFQTEFKSLNCWDSITSLTLIAIFDGEFNVSLSGDDIRSTSTLDDLYQFIINK